MQVHRRVHVRVLHHLFQIDSVSEQATTNPALNPKIEDMLDRYDELLTQAQTRGQELDEVSSRRM